VKPWNHKRNLIGEYLNFWLDLVSLFLHAGVCISNVHLVYCFLE